MADAPQEVGAKTEEFVSKQYTLNESLAILRAESSKGSELSARLRSDEKLYLQQSLQLRFKASENFSIEKQITETDEKIKKEQAKQRVASLKNVAKAAEKKQEVWEFAPKRQDYEGLFYLLQNNPRYFVKLAHLINSKDEHNFVQTVVLDMYGDQYNSREERLLLTIFRDVLRDEFKNAKMSTLLRSNTCTTKMLVAYAKRGPGIPILKEIFGELIKEFISDKKLTLDLTPSKLYTKFIADTEQKTGQECKLPRSVDDATALEHAEVKAMFMERSAVLLDWAGKFLKRILDAPQKIPFGVRWICKQMKQLTITTFPEATRNQIGSVVGGFLFLRFFSPCLCIPDTMNICAKPSSRARRNLIMISKILQNLSNGIRFGDKESHMRVCNPFLDQNTEPLQTYFDTVTNVSNDKIDRTSEVDKYMENVGEHFVLLTPAQISSMHRILIANVGKVAPEHSDPLRPILDRLGNPEEAKAKNDRTKLSLQLQRSRAERLQSATHDDSKFENQQQILNARQALPTVLRHLPVTTEEKTLIKFLRAEHKKNTRFIFVNTVLSQINKLHTEKLIPGDTLEEVGQNFLQTIVQECVNRKQLAHEVKCRLELIQDAIKKVDVHNQFLKGRLQGYKEVLDDVNMKNVLASNAPTKKNTKNQNVVKVTHESMVEMKVIRELEPIRLLVSSGLRVKYTFVQEKGSKGIGGSKRIELVLKAKKRVVQKSFKFTLDVNTLQDEDSPQTLYLPSNDDRYIALNRNLLLHFLYSNFTFISD